MADTLRGCRSLIDEIAHTLRYPDSPTNCISWKGRIGTFYTTNEERSKQVESPWPTLEGFNSLEALTFTAAYLAAMLGSPVPLKDSENKVRYAYKVDYDLYFVWDQTPFHVEAMNSSLSPSRPNQAKVVREILVGPYTECRLRWKGQVSRVIFQIGRETYHSKIACVRFLEVHNSDSDFNLLVDMDTPPLVGKPLHSAESLTPHNDAMVDAAIQVLMAANHPLVAHLPKKDKN